VCDISSELEYELDHSVLEGFDISEDPSTAQINAMPDPIAIVTHIFAHMAIIYLHLVVHSFQNWSSWIQLSPEP
jgi:hypothetical protein